MSVFPWFILLCVSCSQVAAQQPPASAPTGSQPPFVVGVAIPKVVCNANASQSYALYLPSSFSPTRAWPIIYAFDPGARGESAVEAIRDAAEKFGYIVAASNNSKNGSQGGSSEAMQALWLDTQKRFPIDPRRRYVAGMSGGARVASGIALSCRGCVAGVIANGAGFPNGANPGREMKFAYFATVGNNDFNYPEFVELRRKLDNGGVHYRIRIFEGEHGWAPKDTWIEALNWMDIQAMAAGILSRDQPRIQKTLTGELEKARDFQSKNDLLEAFRRYQDVVRDFKGLGDVSEAEKQLAEIQKDKRLKAAEKEEAAAVAQQARLASGLATQIQSIATGDLDATGYAELKRDIDELKQETVNSKSTNDPKAVVVRRALGQLVVQAYESAQNSMDHKDYRSALLYFDLVSAGSEKSGWAHYQRARIYAMSSDRKNMLAELRNSLAGGFHNHSALEVAEFQHYREQDEFQAIMSQWKEAEKNEPAQP
jgi:dienelactone hydrolase